MGSSVSEEPVPDRKFSHSSALKMDVDHAPETSIYSCQRTQRHILENNIGPTLLLILRLWNLKRNESWIKYIWMWISDGNESLDQI
jgi:hypothetical protein